MSVIDAVIAKKLCGGGGGSVPKPLTYDYMPEGYPRKTTGTVTVVAVQEVVFTDDKGKPPYFGHPAEPFEIVVGQTYIVNWDGTEYECICFEFSTMPCLGNLSIAGAGDDTGEPFAYSSASGYFVTLDTSASHTISVKRIEEIVTPMAGEFLPNIPAEKLPAGGSSGGGGQFIVNVYNTNVSGTQFAADKTYEEISAAIDSGMSVVIHRKTTISAATYKVFYHDRTGNGIYNFCHVAFGNLITVDHIDISMVDGKTVIDIWSKEIQTVTS